MGYAASAKGATLMNYCGLTREHIHSIIDDTPAKQGKFTPGANIPIVDSSWLEIEKPDYLILFAWNFAKELMGKSKKHQLRGGRYIIPIPIVWVV